MNELESRIRMARKAGACAIGAGEVSKHKNALTLIAEDAGKHTKAKYPDAKQLKMTKQELGFICGRNEVSIMAITNENLAEQIRKRL